MSVSTGAHILTSGCDKCGACLDASSGKWPGVYLDGESFHRKPTTGVTIAAWISLNRTKGLHSIFQALDAEDETTSVYNMEVVDGHVHWRHIHERYGVPAFDFTTEDVVVPENMWIHVAATYNSTSGTAKLYVNGIQKAEHTNSDKPKLSSSWGKTTLGGHFPKDSPFDGLLDEVLMYNWELDSSELHFVMNYCADHPKLVSFTVRVPIYKRRKIQHISTGKTRATWTELSRSSWTITKATRTRAGWIPNTWRHPLRNSHDRYFGNIPFGKVFTDWDGIVDYLTSDTRNISSKIKNES